MHYDWVSFTTDYGTSDGFVAACKGVIAGIAPAARVLDVTHDVAPQDVRRGATVLAQTVAYLPPAVHLAVVDPGVGTDRRGVVLVAGHSLLVGPDNGLLLPAAEALGGVRAAYELTEPRFWLPEVSTTFHGRDVFAPASAHLARGVPPAEFGPSVADLVRLPEPRTLVADGRLTSDIIGVDRFGNLQLAAGAHELAAFGLRRGDQVRVRHNRSTVDGTVGDTFADVPPGSLLVLVDSAGQLSLAVNGGSAAEALGGRTGDVTLSR
ncbi:MAG TPA: SAM-dependent chlorinase/fluorinase [Pseudonocardiaceae bacterium]|nr:SAM-dependent chlorinase/fluorinase [Pseudonocardiaceae bacterium]